MQLDHPLRRVAIVGQSGCGKTTWAAKFLANTPARCRYIWDPEGEWAGRFGLPLCTTAEQMDAEAPFGWVCFNPWANYSDMEEALDAFCEYVMGSCERYGGTKVFVVDEMHDYVSGHKLPPNLLSLVTRGRRRGIDSVFLCTSPNRLHNVIRSNITERVVFHCDDPTAGEFLESWGFRPDEVAALPPHRWIARSSMGGMLRG